jgi:hypothetical protein
MLFQEFRKSIPALTAIEDKKKTAALPAILPEVRLLFVFFYFLGKGKSSGNSPGIEELPVS